MRKTQVALKSLNNIQLRAVVARRIPNGRHEDVDPAFGKEVTEYWLTESAALFVASRSDTKVGAAMLHRLIAAWVMSRQDVRVQNIIQLCSSTAARIGASNSARPRS